MRIRLHDLFYLLSIMLLQPHDPKIVLNGLTYLDLSCFFVTFF
jgi:hypothetical protein